MEVLEVLEEGWELILAVFLKHYCADEPPEDLVKIQILIQQCVT